MTWQIVDRLAEDADVILDLGNRDPWMVTDWSCPPPERRRMGQTSALYDGSVEAGSVHDDRTLNLTLDLCIRDRAEEGNGNAAVRFVSELAIVLDRPQWLRYTPNDADTPVYFRLRANTPSSIDERPVQDGQRVVVLTLVAEPFGYGPLVTLTRNVVNDPAVFQPAGSGRYSIEFSPGQIVGDVAAPLIVSLPTVAESFFLSAMAGGVVNPAPDRVVNSPTVGNGEEGVIISSSDQNLASCSGGKYRRLAYTQDNSEAAGTTFRMVCDFGQQYVGEYRLLLRARGRNGGSTVTIGQTTRRVETGNFLVYDLGVVPVDVAGIEGFDEPSTATAKFVIESTSIEVDYALLVPVGVTGTRANRVTYGRATPGFVVDARRPGRFPMFFGGAYPKVWPGTDNYVTLLCGLATGATAGADNVDLVVGAQQVTTATLSYYPRYLYAAQAS